MIGKYRNKLEPGLKDGGRYSHLLLRGAISKINMQIIKIAANMQLLSSNHSLDDCMIDDAIVETAINIADAVLEAEYKLCIDKGIIGTKAAYESILALFEINKTPRPERTIIQSKSQTKPFKDFTGNKSKLIKDTLSEMVKYGFLQISFSGDGKPVKQYSPA